MSIKLNDTQLVLLSAASQRDDHCLVRPAGPKRAQARCWRSSPWAGKARRPGARCSTISSGADSRTPELVVVDGAPGLEKALAALWPDMAVQRCTVHYAELRIMPTSAAKPAWEAVIAVKEAA